jgi:hypothetical protein
VCVSVCVLGGGGPGNRGPETSDASGAPGLTVAAGGEIVESRREAAALQHKVERARHEEGNATRGARPGHDDMEATLGDRIGRDG